MKLYTKVFIGLIAGAVVGLIGNLAGVDWLFKLFAYMDLYGRAFIKLITMIIIPLVVASLMVGIASLGDLRKLGRIGAKTFIYFLITTVTAATLGVVVALVVKPGGGVDPSIRDVPEAQLALKAGEGAAGPSITDTLMSIIPSNPVTAAAQTDLLGLIFFTVMFAAATGALPPDRRRAVLGFFEGVNEASMVVLGWVIKLAPTAVFALIASVVARFGVGLLRNLALFVLTVIVGLLIHVIVIYGLAVKFLVKMNPATFFRRIVEVPLMALSTSSSSAVLPISMATAKKELGISSGVSGFVLPLGATINKNGSALFKSVAVMFIADVFGVQMGLPRQVMLILAATLSAMASAGVAGSGMVSIIVVLKIVGLGWLAPAGIALVVGVDRINDMLRTATNVTGNMVCAAYIARSEGETIAPLGAGQAARTTASSS